MKFSQVSDSSLSIFWQPKLDTVVSSDSDISSTIRFLPFCRDFIFLLQGIPTAVMFLSPVAPQFNQYFQFIWVKINLKVQIVKIHTCILCRHQSPISHNEMNFSSWGNLTDHVSWSVSNCACQLGCKARRTQKRQYKKNLKGFDLETDQ